MSWINELIDLYEKNNSNNDLEDKWLEIFNYHYSRNRNAKKVEFTLRSSEHLRKFEYFLDKLIVLMDNFPREFSNLFPRCPETYWDKIDDLRDTSFKQYRDSDAFTRCLEKSKKISFGYERIMGINLENDESHGE